MLKKSNNYVNIIAIFILVVLSFIPLKPQNVDINTIIENDFSLQNAFNHVKKISKFPHYVGSENHKQVQNYIIKQLQNLGLKVTIQKTNIANQYNTYIQVENILAKIDGSDKGAESLVVMSHYDSTAYASLGAADAGSGVAVVLEGIRAYLQQNITPKNDIIILISDAEEIGLLGAKAFVNKHHWADNVGAVLNFEARGTAGSSYMLMETNHGNKQLLNSYNSAGLQFQSSNSLAYSIYKMLPNDTDLSVFRKDKDIVGYNFAFIDNHFNYHTSLDNAQNLSLDSLAHQAYYLMPMLNKLSQIDLTTLQSDEDDVYFQMLMLDTISYPYDWAVIISVINLLLFTFVIVIGIKNKTLQVKPMLTGSFPLFKSLIITALISFTLLKFLYWLHPHYSEMLQGFTYNGHVYILFFSLLALSICFFLYKRVSETHSASDLMVAPVFIWILISFASAFLLTGAHFFTLISLAGTIALLINVLSKKTQTTATLLLFIPVVLIFSPFLMQLPVALGLIILPFSGLLLVLILSVFISTIQLPNQHVINKWVFIVLLASTYIYAETKASFNSDRPIPNSLFYFQDKDSDLAYWFSHDNKMDDWTKDILINNTLDANNLIKFKNQFWSRAKIVAKAENIHIPVAQIEVLTDRRYTDRHVYQLKITPQPGVNKLIFRTNSAINILNLRINNESLHEGKSLKIKAGRRIIGLHRTVEVSFIIDIEIAANETLDLSLIEINPNLLNSRFFNIKPRPKEYIPKPFIYSDSIITKQTIKL